MRRILDGLVTSLVSYFFIAVLLLLIRGFDQGSILIIDLLSDPFSLFLFLVFFNAFAVILSHYPSFIHMRRREADKKFIEDLVDGDDQITVPRLVTSWSSEKPRIIGLGIIQFEENDVVKRNLEGSTSRIIRKLSGAFLHVALIYVLLAAFELYSVTDFKSIWVLALLALGVGFAFWKYEARDSDYLNWRRLYRFINPLIAILVIALMCCSALKGWHPFTFALFSLLEILALLWFFIWSFHRKSLEEPTILFGLVPSNHYHQAVLIFCVGWLAFLTIIISYVLPLWISPIVVIISYCILYYGIIILPLKQHFYYESEYSEDETFYQVWQRVFRIMVNWGPVLLIGMMIFTGFKGNDLHRLDLIAKGKVYSSSEYFKSISENFDKESPVHLISSYGGGLKANAWVLQLFKDWSQDTIRSEYLERAVSLSGVSGGALGLSFYHPIDQLYDKRESRDSVLDLVSRSDFLSVDLTYLLGYDFIRELMVWQECFSPDRSKRSMALYADMIGDAEMCELSFGKYWKMRFDHARNNDRFYPNLFINSTGTNSQRGIASGVEFDDFDSTFPNSIDLVNHGDSSLKYVQAVSCANRFPLFSPAAKVPGKGHFLDGGYFENSGILTSWNFYEKMEVELDSMNYKARFINIINDQGSYIRFLLDHLLCEERIPSKASPSQGDLVIDIEERESSEILAILQTVASTSSLPNYIREKQKLEFDLRDDLEVQEVFLPHLIRVKDVEKVLGGCIEDKMVLDCVASMVERNNEMIRKAIDSYCDSFPRQCKHPDAAVMWNAVEPPLARILTEPAVTYMKAMIHHDLCYPDTLKLRLGRVAN